MKTDKQVTRPDTKQVRLSVWAHKKLKILAVEKEYVNIGDAIDDVVAFHETHKNGLGKK